MFFFLHITIIDNSSSLGGGRGGIISVKSILSSLESHAAIGRVNLYFCFFWTSPLLFVMAWPFVCSLVNEKLGCECANVGCGWKTVSVRALWKTYLILDFLVCAHAQHSPSHPACLKKSEQKTRTEHWEKKKRCHDALVLSFHFA